MQSKYNTLITFLILFAATGLSVGLVVARYFFQGQLSHTFLVWNLFLAWIPLVFAWVVRFVPLPRLLKVPFVGLWLLFFPNAPYILTDVVHLRGYYLSNVFWFDMMMILTFALTGLFVGFTSLAWIQAEVRDWLNAFAGWLVVLFAVGLSGLGVYIGRFLRWNSWDVFSQPEVVATDILNQFIDPSTLFHSWSLSLFFGALLLVCYLMMVFIPAALQPRSTI